MIGNRSTNEDLRLFRVPSKRGTTIVQTTDSASATSVPDVLHHIASHRIASRWIIFGGWRLLMSLVTKVRVGRADARHVHGAPERTPDAPLAWVLRKQRLIMNTGNLSRSDIRRVACHSRTIHTTI